VTAFALAAHQFRYDQKAFWRNPASVFFTVAFPVILLLIFATVFGDQTVSVGGVHGGIETTTYYVPAIITLSVISATMQTLAMSLVIAREDGRLKRGRGTPMPPWVFIAGRIGNAIVVALIMMALISVIGRVLYGVPVPWDRLPTIVVTLVVGAASFCCLGIALTAAIPSQDAAAPIVNAMLLPLYFLSGVFIPDDQLPSGVIHFADVFPVRHFFEAFFNAYVPAVGGGSGISWDNLAVVAVWGVGGLFLAARYFRWTPRGG
jgi:ABC-2 type transport system permease protein